MPKRKFDETVNVPIQISEQSTSLCKSILSEDGALKYDFMISLQKIAMANIVAALFMNKNIVQQYLEHCKAVNKSMDFIIDKISALHLPSTFTRILINVFQSMGLSVVRWISYHDEYVFNGYGLREKLAYYYISNIKWNARGRIDHDQTAKNMLATRDNCLSDEQKYRLACTHCLEDEIAVFAPKVVHEGYLDGLDAWKNPMVYFWTAHITGDTRNISIASFFKQENFYQNYSHNEVPIRFMWNRLSAEEKSECISLFPRRIFIECSCFEDFTCSVLSTMNYKQQQDVFRVYSRDILGRMIDDWLWEEYFLPTTLHVLNIMKSDDYAYLLYDILLKIRYPQIKERGLCNYYKSMFELLWRKAPIHVEDSAFEWLNYALSSNSGWIPVDLYETVLKDFTAEQKKNFFFGDIRFFCNILKGGKFEKADYLIKYCEASLEEINNFKNKLMLWEGRKCFEIFNKDIWPLVIKWCNPSNETVADLKEYLNCSSIFDLEYFSGLLDEFLENRSLNLAGDEIEPQCRIFKK